VNTLQTQYRESIATANQLASMLQAVNGDASEPRTPLDRIRPPSSPSAPENSETPVKLDAGKTAQASATPCQNQPDSGAVFEKEATQDFLARNPGKMSKHKRKLMGELVVN
jgi:hypothetical protein